MTRLTHMLLIGASLLVLSTTVQTQQALAQQALPQADDSYFKAAAAQLTEKLGQQLNTGRAKNVILFVGDGMSIPTITATRIYQGQKAGRDGESNVLAFEQALPFTALSKTYTHDAQVADSAPTAVAMTTGVKTLNGVIGVNQHAVPKKCEGSKALAVTTVFEQAEAAGLATGIISTARITHATPASTYAHTPDRDWENDSELTDEARANGCKDIAAQLVEWPAGNGFEVILGGGRGAFFPKEVADVESDGKKGYRLDGRDLTAEWLKKYNDGAYVWNAEQFNAVDLGKTGHVLGLFERSHMQYEADRAKDKGGEPSLAEMTVKAIELLSRNDQGFVLMVEGGRVDHANHAGNAARALADAAALDDAVKAALTKVSLDDTLVIVTADHSHTLTINGYPKRNNPILGIAGKDDAGRAYTTLQYANGPGAKLDGLREDPASVDTTDVDYLQPALVPLKESETHGGDDVAIFAGGPWAHLFHGSVEQNLIYHVIAKATDINARMPK